MNVAEDSATVGVQAETVHGDVSVYQVLNDSSPKDRFEVGVNCLRGGMADRAREIIGDAVENGCVTSRSCFYLLLATLSGRSLQQVPPEEIGRLNTLQGRFAHQADDQWTEATKLISRVLAALQTGTIDPRVIDKEFMALGPEQREEILQHLEMFLTGQVQDAMWARSFEAARQARSAGDREGRAWKFFQPRPAEARVRWPRPVEVGVGELVVSGLLGTVAVAACGFVAVHAWRYSWPLTALAVALLGIGVALLVRHAPATSAARPVGTYAAARGGRGAPGGFARKIDRQFDHYFALYVPHGMERADWLAATAATRKALRDEVVEIYRESRVSAEQVAWLTRFLVGEARTAWLKDLPAEPDRRVPVVPAALLTVLGAGALAWGGLHASAFPAATALIIGFGAAWVAAVGGLRIAGEHRRHAVEKEQAEHKLEARREALARWRSKLADQPSDEEMARWLDCDRKALMAEAMRHYRLSSHDIIAHAFIETPGTSYKRARVAKGPWRYTGYRLLVFLLTVDGVRQMSATLSFGKAALHVQGHYNFRYDAVASVEVTEGANGRLTFDLTLMSGHSLKANLMDDSESRDDSLATLDSAGVRNTLHVLEGVAAEGREWINHERRREQDGLAHLAYATHQIFSPP
ncbi:hypothetical protein [Nonomuraea longicatena]|uniref:Uncharacterized protein n=1 Tax=Nonomuraea longicatena TaxID=83682 RepID=A0ABN1PX94_9ACTN